MKLINNYFDSLKHFSVERDLPSTHSAKIMPKQNGIECNFFFFIDSK